MRRMTMRRIVIVGATASAVLLTGGVAFAFWSSTGTGAGTAVVATTASELTVSQVGTPTGLFPGGDPIDIVARVDNTTATDIQFADVEVTVADVVDANGDTIGTGCPTTDFRILDAPYVGGVILAGATTGPQTVATIELLNTTANQDACKGASVVLSLVAS